MSNVKAKVKSNKYKIKNPFIVIGASVLGVAVLIFIYNLAYMNRVFPKTYIGGKNFGGLSKEEVKNSIEQIIKPDTKIKIIFQDKNWEISGQDLSVEYKKDDTANMVWNVGRSGNVILEQLKSIFGKNQKLAAISYNQDALNEKIQKIAEEVDKPEKDAGLSAENGNLEVSSEQSGLRVQKDALKNDILDNFSGFSKKDVILVQTEVVEPYIKTFQAEKAKVQAGKILEGNLTI